MLAHITCSEAAELAIQEHGLMLGDHVLSSIVEGEVYYDPTLAVYGRPARKDGGGYFDYQVAKAREIVDGHRDLPESHAWMGQITAGTTLG